VRRVTSLLALEVRLEYRYGIHAVGAILAVLWTGLLIAVPSDTARSVVPFVLFADSATIGGFLLAAIVLFERNERVLSAIITSPVRVREYIGVKVVALTALSIAVAVPIAVVAGREGLRLGPVLLGVALTAVLMLVLCLALVAPHRSIIGFLTVAPWPLIPLMAIPLARSVGLLDHPLAVAVPTAAALDLIDSGFDERVHASAAAVAYLLAWIGACGVLARRRFEAAVRASGG